VRDSAGLPQSSTEHYRAVPFPALFSEWTFPADGTIRSQLRYQFDPYLWDLQMLEQPVPASVYLLYHLERYSLLTPPPVSKR
jgi:hypothetical protein